MKKYIYSTILVITAASAYTFEVTGDHFKANFTIDSVTVGENHATVNVSSKSADVGQYGKVYLSYTFTSNPAIKSSGTWEGHGRGISPDGVMQRGILKGVWTRDGGVINMKSLDSVTDGVNYMQGTLNLLTGNVDIEVYAVK